MAPPWLSLLDDEVVLSTDDDVAGFEPAVKPAVRFGLVLLWVVIAGITRWLAFFVPVLDIDETAHIVGSWELLRGGLLYTDFVDNKPPLVYAYYAAAQWLAGPTLIGVRAVTTLVVVPLTAHAVSAWFGHTRRGIVAATAFLLYSSAFLAHDMLSANAEILMVLPGAWALALVNTEAKATVAWRAALAGVLLGLACLFKHQIAMWLPAVMLVTAWAAWRRGALPRAGLIAGAVAAGWSLPLVATWSWFRAHGGEQAMVYWLVTSNLGYAANPIRLGEAGERALANLLPFVIVTAPLWWAAWQGRRSDEPDYRRALAVTVLAASVPPVFVGLRFFPHYFIQLYVPLALAAAPALEAWVTTRPRLRAGPIVVAWTTAVVSVAMLMNAVLYFGDHRIYQETDPVYRRVAERLCIERCDAGATLFVWGYGPPFYYESRLRPATRFVVMVQSRLTPYVPGNRGSQRRLRDADSTVIVPEHWDWLMADLERHRATYILDAAPSRLYGWHAFPIDDYPRLRDYLKRHYALLDTIGGVRVYRRSDAGRRDTTGSDGETSRTSAANAPAPDAHHAARSQRSHRSFPMMK